MERSQPGFPQQAMPTAQSVLWRPAIQELARPDTDLSPIFIAQRALAAVEDHLHSAPRQALLGFLVGRVFEDAGQPYLVVHGAIRVPQVIVGGATESVVAPSLAAAQRVIRPEDGVVVGWYKSDPGGTVELSPQDHAAHVRHFHEPWQVALVVTPGPPQSSRGGLFRPTGDPGSSTPYLSFYELLDAETFRDGWKQPRLFWINYWSPDPAVWRVTRATTPRPARLTPFQTPPGSRRSGPAVLPGDERDDSGPRWRGLPRIPWQWGAAAVVALAAVVGAVLLGIRIGLGTASAPTATPAAPVGAADTTPARSPDAAAMDPVRRAIDGYRARAKLFGSHQTTCDDLARAFADVDEQWLHYTLAAPQTAPEDTTTATPQGRLAADVDEVESDFERSGCPRP
ncbi:MAG TPA: hypothetical protein VEU73_12040 [Gemmatimonadales bacterium]|nr:hypothetical protein [Gemmatimonadales bacterium]